MRGKTGVRPVINNTSTTQCIEMGAFVLWWFENLELDQDGASGNVITNNTNANGSVFYNIKISDGGGAGTSGGATGQSISACEITGVVGDALSALAASSIAFGNYIHDTSADGIEITSAGPAVIVISRNILDTCAGKGINFSGATTTPSHRLFIDGNTIYGCGDSGLEVTDADSQMMLINNIFSENGNAAGEYNVEWVAGTAEANSFHGWNVFYHSGGGGGANLSGLTVNAQVASSEFTTDPAFTDAAGGDFSISSTSPAKASGFPGQFL